MSDSLIKQSMEELKHELKAIHKKQAQKRFEELFLENDIMIIKYRDQEVAFKVKTQQTRFYSSISNHAAYVINFTFNVGIYQLFKRIKSFKWFPSRKEIKDTIDKMVMRMEERGIEALKRVKDWSHFKDEEPHIILSLKIKG